MTGLQYFLFLVILRILFYLAIPIGLVIGLLVYAFCF